MVTRIKRFLRKNVKHWAGAYFGKPTALTIGTIIRENFLTIVANYIALLAPRGKPMTGVIFTAKYSISSGRP